MRNKKQLNLTDRDPLSMEWLDTNGTGGYASSTVAGSHTRKYHGLLVSRLAEPPGKYVLLSKLDDSVYFEDTAHSMTAHRYKNASEPPAGLRLTAFSQDKCPTFDYQFGPVNVQKALALVQGEDTLMVHYACSKNQVRARLRIKPLLAFRNFHTLTRENIFLHVRTFPKKNGFVISPYDGMPPLFIQCNTNFEFYPGPCWYRNFEYQQEIDRGFDATEDLFCPGIFEMTFPKGASVLLTASLKEQEDIDGSWERELSARRTRNRQIRGTRLQKALKRTARQFVTTTPEGQTSVVAGFHWFLEWGRDAMIALPGLLLDNGQMDTYIAVLKGFAAHRKNGIIPNFLGDTPANNAYNSADASLWFGFAVQKYLHRTNNPGAIRGELADALADIFHWYRAGTENHIRMLDNGLLTVGTESDQLTWMDATVNGRPVTPRHGCPVEINALWYNFVAFIAKEGGRMGVTDGQDAALLLPKIEASFNDAYWIDRGGYLADGVRENRRDDAVRCNQIFAVSLPFSPLEERRARQVVEKVTAELVTPLGLRTLSPEDPGFAPYYAGTPDQRDAAYHNGTVWPWLLGHYGDALLKVSSDKRAAVSALESILEAFEKHLDTDGLDTISEVFDGGEPTDGRGCISQAWSVAEILRLTGLVANARSTLGEE